MNIIKPKLYSKARIKETIVRYNGTLYKDEIVKVIQKENGDYRVQDSMGKIWYIPKNKFKEVI
jgi:hypothetical protein